MICKNNIARDVVDAAAAVVVVVVVVVLVVLVLGSSTVPSSMTLTPTLSSNCNVELQCRKDYHTLSRINHSYP